MMVPRKLSIHARSLAFAVLCVASAPATALADHVVLRNGDSLTGRVASISTDGLELDSELAGRITVKWTAIVSLAGGPSVRAARKDGTIVVGPISVDAGRIAVQPPGSGPLAIDVGSLSSLTLASTHPGAATWHGTMTAGLDLSRGNATTSTVSTAGTLTRLGSRDKVGIFGTYLFSSVGSGADRLTTVRATRGGVRYDHDVSGPAFAFGFSDVENDPYQLLDLRTVAGAGAGVHAVKTVATQLNFIGGVSYARDRYIAETTGGSADTAAPVSPGQSVSTAGRSGSAPGHQERSGAPPDVIRTSLTRSVAEYVTGEDLTQQVSDNVSFTEGLTFFAATDNVHDFRVSFDLTLSSQITGWLQWNLSVADRYLNIPPAGGAVQNDVFVTTGLGISFGRGDAGRYTGTETRPAPKR